MRSFRNWHAITLLGALVAVFFRDILLQRAWFWEDFLNQAYPFRNFAAVSIAAGELPLWNPFTFGGMPFQADIQSAVFYLPNLLLTLFVRDSRLSFYAFEVQLIVHYWVAGITMYYLARSLDLEPVYAFYSGLLYCLSGFLVVQAIHPAFVQQLAWLPLIFLLCRRALLEKSLLHSLLAGLVLGLSLFAGSPQVTMYVVLLLLLYTIFEFLRGLRHSGFSANAHMIWMATLLLLTAASVAAIQLLPTIELRPLSERATLTFEQAQYGRLAFPQLLTGAIPKLFGATSASGNEYWGPGGYGAYWESCFYLGICGAFTAVWALGSVRRLPVVFFLAMVSIVAILVALGDQSFLHRLFFDFVPGFSTFRATGRIMLLVTFSASILGGIGLRSFLESAVSRPKRTLAGIAVAAGVLTLIVLLLQLRILLPIELQNDAKHVATMREAFKALAIAAAVLGTGLLVVFRAIPIRVALPVLVLVQYTDVNLFAATQNNGVQSDKAYFDEIKPQVIQRLKDDGATEFFRVVTRNGATMWLDRNHGMVERIFLLEGYTPLKLSRAIPPARDSVISFDMMNAKYRAWLESNGNMVLRLFDSYLPRVWMVHSAIIVPGDSVAQVMRSERFNPRTTVVLENAIALPLPDSAPAMAARASIQRYKPNDISVHVDAPAHGILVFSEVHYPGWSVSVDGEAAQLLRANWSLRAVAVPEGTHLVQMRFVPASFRNGAWVTSVTLVLLLIAIARQATNRRRSL